MSEKPSAKPRARLFFALDPPDSTREGLLEWQRAATADEALRPVAAAALHSTLCFLGSRAESEIPRLVSELRPELAEPTELTLDPLPAAIPPSRPRLFALGASSEAALRLQAKLERALSGAGLHEPEKRPFWPHITIARVRSEGGRKRRPRRVEDPPGRLPDSLLEPFHAVRVALYRSYLRPGGSHYVSLASLELPRPAQPGAEKR